MTIAEAFQHLNDAYGINLSIVYDPFDRERFVHGFFMTLLLSIVSMVTGNDPYHGLNAGFLGLVLNLIVTGMVTVFSRADESGFGQPELSVAAVPKLTSKTIITIQ